VKADAFDRRSVPEGRRNLLGYRTRQVWDMAAGIGVYLRTMAVFLLVWHAAALWIGNPILLPTPIDVAQSFVELAGTGEMVTNIVVSVTRLVMSFLLAAVVAVPLGFAMGLNRTVFEMVDPTVELLRPISGLAWIPLGLFILGIGDALPTAIMFYGAFFPLLINTITAVRSVDRTYLNAARTLGVGRATVLTQVVIPAALPGILVGARLAAGAGWMSMVAAELIGAPSGLGFAVEWYRELLMTSKVLVFVVLIGLMGYLFDRALRYLQRSMTRWAEPRNAS
jgi:ABC-type nitrate/sulfonate/bicarbonate transport system permease component